MLNVFGIGLTYELAGLLHTFVVVVLMIIRFDSDSCYASAKIVHLCSLLISFRHLKFYFYFYLFFVLIGLLMEISEVAESRRAESSESGGARTFKRRRESASDVELLASSPSSCVVPDSKKRILFPHTPPNARSVVSVLLPNNTKLTLSSGLASQVDSLEEFLNCIRTKAEKVFEDGPTKRKRLVRWEKVFLEDWHGHRIASVAALNDRLKKPNVTILVQDGDSDTKHCHEVECSFM